MALRVNGEVIPEEAIEFELKRLVKFYTQHMPREEVTKQLDLLRHKAREQAVGAKLLMNEAARLEIKVPPADIDSKLADLKKKMGGEKAYREMLKKQDLPESTVVESIEKGRKVDIMVEQIVQGIEEPTEDEMKAHYQEHRQEYMKGDMAQVQHILIKPESASHEDRATAVSLLQEIKASLGEGADFAEQAAAHSQCPSGQRTGGSLGWLTRGMLVPEIDSVIFTLKDGEVSDVVESELGFHLMKKTGTQQGGQADYPEVAETIRDFLRHARRGATLTAYVDELRKKAVIEED